MRGEGRSNCLIDVNHTKVHRTRTLSCHVGRRPDTKSSALELDMWVRQNFLLMYRLCNSGRGKGAQSVHITAEDGWKGGVEEEASFPAVPK